MAKSTEAPPDFTYDDIVDDNTKFKARIAHTNLKGVKHLTLEVDRPFRSTHELAAWLHANVVNLRSDLDNNKDLAWDR